jgi:acid phosphatase type 7
MRPLVMRMAELLPATQSVLRRAIQRRSMYLMHGGVGCWRRKSPHSRMGQSDRPEKDQIAVAVHRVLITLLVPLVACSGDRLTQPSGPVLLTRFTAPTDTVTLVGAGDIAGCGTFYIDEVTGRMIDSVLQLNPKAQAFTAGDNAYPSGRPQDWACFDLSWGKFKARTWYAIGNHELNLDTAGTATYDYVLGVGVDSAENGVRGKFYHAHDFGAWRVYFLNTQRNIAEQTAWLTADLAANPRLCQLMVFHRPLHSAGTGELAPARTLRPWHLAFWKARGDVIVNGHAHHYRRTTNIRPDTSSGVVAEATKIDTATGYRLFIEGGGGHTGLTEFGPALFYDQKRIKSNGVLKLTLYPTRYKWERLDTSGLVVDQGQRGCH